MQVIVPERTVPVQASTLLVTRSARRRGTVLTRERQQDARAATRHMRQADMIITAAQHDQRRVLARSALLTLGPIDSSPGTARVAAMAQLSQWGRGHLSDDTASVVAELVANAVAASVPAGTPVDRKSTRLNSSHRCISYAV